MLHYALTIDEYVYFNTQFNIKFVSCLLSIFLASYQKQRVTLRQRSLNPCIF